MSTITRIYPKAKMVVATRDTFHREITQSGVISSLLSISPEIPAEPLFIGEVYVGCIIDRLNGQYEAGRPNGESLGLFTSWTAAAQALVAAAYDERDR